MLRMGKTTGNRRFVAVMVPYANKAGREFFAGVLRQSRLLGGWKIRVIQSGEEVTDKLVDGLIAAPVSGVIVCGIGAPQIVRRFADAGIPMVVEGEIHRSLYDGKKPVSCISVDERYIGACAADYLLKLGSFGAYGFVPCRDTHLAALSKLRGDGFRQACAQRNTDIRIFAPDGDWSASLERWLKSLPSPAAVFTPIDRHGREILDACERAGLGSPERIAILGAADDERYCLTNSPELSSITTGAEEEGYAAAAELARLMRTTGRTAKPRCRVIKTTNRVSERESTAPLVPAASLISRALEFIEANATRDIGVADVIRELGCSRRLAEMRFRKLRGETINAAIVRVRLECFRRKLRDSKAPAASVARACGFANVAYLSTLFKRTFGVTIRQWRQAKTPVVECASFTSNRVPPHG